MEKVDDFSQTETTHKIFQPSDNDNEITASGPELFKQYQKCLRNFLLDCDTSQISAFRSEIVECIQKRYQYQLRTYGQDDLDCTKLPPNVFSGFSTSLVLVLQDESFILYSTSPGFEISGDIITEGKILLGYICAGILPPIVYNSIKSLNLSWYDGGIICEVVDKRRELEKITRIHLKVRIEDLGKIPFEQEHEILLHKYPLICTSPDLHVTAVARAVSADAGRWPTFNQDQTSLRSTEYLYPHSFINAAQPQPENRSTDELRKMAFESIQKIHN